MVVTAKQLKSVLMTMHKTDIDEFVKEYNYKDINDDLKREDLKDFLLKKGEVINIAREGIDRTSALNGEGLRFTIFCQGCDHNCKGCQNPETHNPDDGVLYSVDELLNDFATVSSYTNGITLSGGDPLYPGNYEGVLKLCKKFKSIPLFENKNIWLYTGCTWEDDKLKELEIVNYVDIIVDGEFDIDKKSYDVRFKGSKNQRIIDVDKTLECEEVILKELR